MAKRNLIHEARRGDDPDGRVAEFDTLEELLAIPWVSAWTQRKAFDRLVRDRNRLMALFGRGLMWHVVGYLVLVSPVEGLEEWGATE